MNPISRRTGLKLIGQTLAGVTLAASRHPLLAADEPGPFQIGACDWSIGKAHDVEALSLAGRIGLDGVQVSFGDPGALHDLRKQEVRDKYAEASKKYGVRIASLAMGVLNNIPYSSDPRAEQWVLDCIGVMSKMNQKRVLLAFFGKGDINGKPELQKEVIRRLKAAAPKAEAAGVVLGLESWLSAEDHLRIIDAVGSPAVKVYYDVANSNKMGYDIYQEIEMLGTERICEIHCKENGFLLGHGRIDFQRLHGVLGKIGYQGWLIIESAVGKGVSAFDSYVHNQRFLRSVFQTG